MKILGLWIEGEGDKWRILFKSDDLRLYYSVGQMWCPHRIGAKVFASRDEAVLEANRQYRIMSQERT